MDSAEGSLKAIAPPMLREKSRGESLGDFKHGSVVRAKLHGRWSKYTSIAEAQMMNFLVYLGDVLTLIEYLLEVIKERPKEALEFGCGTGFHSSFISKFVRHMVCLDLNVKTLRIARENVKKFGDAGKVGFIVGDVFHLPFRSKAFDVAFSQGLLEHFSSDEAKQILREASACARAVIVSVPSLNYPRRDLGDERLLSPASWQEILREFKPKVRYYVLDFQSIKNSLLAKRIPKPWHILIKIRP
jgi:SAM-dependent methyltransferase